MELRKRNRYAAFMNPTPSLQQIPTHLIAGPLGAGKTSVLKHLMQQRPANEVWAVLVNEFGQLGIDAALLKGAESGVQIAEIPGGCLCCVNGLPFQVGLGRLLRRARPQRLFIEASGLGHPAVLMQQLATAPWLGVLALQPLIMVLDAPRLLAGTPLAPSQAAAIPEAGLIVLNKSENSDPDAARAAMAALGAPAWVCSVHGAVSLDALPRLPAGPQQAMETPIADGPAAPPALWRSPDDWHCFQQDQDGHTSIGWRIHPSQIFAAEAIEHWLLGFAWVRAKGVLHTATGWQAFNALAGERVQWSASEWRRDNRAELIIASSENPRMTRQGLEKNLRAAVINLPIKDPGTSL